MGRTQGHEEIVEILRGRGAAQGATLLDIPSGSGPVQDGAREAGYDVVGVDLFPTPGLRGVLADACAPLPFRTGSFDVVLSMEGIEHFENQTAFVRECARVLKPGGTLLLTTPNMMHLSARLSGVVTGNKSLRHGVINEVSTLRGREGRRIYHGHAYLIDIFRLRYILRVVGLELTDLAGTTLSSISVALAPLVPLISVLTSVAQRNARRRRERKGLPVPDAALEDELRRLGTSGALCFRKKLIVTATKPLRTPEGSDAA
jgi:SAM-dependent methyltransferase